MPAALYLIPAPRPFTLLGMTEQQTNQIDPELIAILRCPLTLSKLRQQGDFLIAEVGGLAKP